MQGHTVSHQVPMSTQPHRGQYTVYITLLLTLVLACTPQVVHAGQGASAPPLPQWDIALAWDAYLRYPGWTELHVTLTNEEQPWEGGLQIQDDFNELVYTLPLDLPAHSQKHYQIPVYIEEIYALKVSLRPAAGGGITQTLKNFRQPQGRVCAVMDALGLTQLGPTEHCDVTLVLGNDTRQLPETPMAWDTIDVLVVNGISTMELEPAQREALYAWVSAGGHLIVSGGLGLSRAIEGLPAPLQIAQAGSAHVITDTLLFNNEESVAVALIPQADATPLVTYEDITLGVQQDVGFGHVDIVSWDLNQTGALSWFRTLWAKDTIPAITYLYNNQPLSHMLASKEALTNIPQDILPKFQILFYLFPIYLLLVGPGTWLLTRKLGRPNLTWTLLPLWIALGVLVMLLHLSGTLSHNFPLTHDLAVVLVPESGHPARVMQGTAIFAPQSRQLSWETPAYPRPLWGHYTTEGLYSEGDPFVARVIHTPGDTARIHTERPVGLLTWASEGVMTSPALTVSLTFDVQATGNALFQGQITSDVPLNDVKFVINTPDGKSSYPLASQIPAEQSLALSTIITPQVPYYQSYKLCDYIHDSWRNPSISLPTQELLYAGDTCYIVARMEGVPFPTQNLKGTHIMETCMLYLIPCPTATTRR